MSKNFLRELARQRRDAESWLHRSVAAGDDFMADLARVRLADLERIAARSGAALPA